MVTIYILGKMTLHTIYHSIAQAVVLGIIQGTTEYLPVSSGAHLLLAERWMFPTACPQAFDGVNTLLQFGSVWVVFLFYRKQIGKIFAGLMGRSREGLRLFSNLLCAFFPTAVAGHLGGFYIREHCENLNFIASALAVGGAYIFAVVRFCQPRQRLTSLSWRQSFFIGVLQSIALFPGVSRSLMTISAGLWMGLTMADAVEFSFLLGAGTIGAATLYQFIVNGMLLDAGWGPVSLASGIISAFIASAAAMKFSTKRFSMGLLSTFAWYRITLALLIFNRYSGSGI
ncbi:MAG: undecaprenyl-diphosphate phosphatase [Puniceicoccales bacterium]|jgi:undecaprenyl-diphosphatase|nr:undecaprenyl-diphosphate phosphatase [Puniceicoccales bacterium]